MKSDARTQKRWQLVTSLRIYDGSHDDNEDVLLGHLFDISTEGIRMISDKAIVNDQEYKFRMYLPIEGQDDPDTCSITVRSIWTKKDSDESLYDSGFKLIDVPANIESRLVQLIDELKSTQTP